MERQGAGPFVRTVLAVLVISLVAALIAGGGWGRPGGHVVPSGPSVSRSSLPAAPTLRGPGGPASLGSAIGPLVAPSNSFGRLSLGCTSGLNGSCPHLTPAISSSTPVICRSGETDCGGAPYDTKVTLTVNATGTTLTSPPNVQVVFVVETTLFDGVYDNLAGEPGRSSCGGPCAESNGVPFFTANAGEIATKIADKFGGNLSSCNPTGQNSVCFALVDYFSTQGADHDDGDGSAYNPDVSTFVPADQFGSAVQSSFQTSVLDGGWVYGDSDFSDNTLSSSAITGVYGAERGSGLAWNPNADHVIVWMGSSVPRDPNYVVNYSVGDSNQNSGNSSNCEPVYFSGQPNCYGWAEPSNSIGAYAKANNIVIDTVDLANGATNASTGDYLGNSSVAQADVNHVLQAGCDMAVATGGTWEGPSGFSCTAAATGTGQGNLTCVQNSSCEGRGKEYDPNVNWSSNPALGWALTNINFPSTSSNVSAKGTTGDTFNFIPAPYFAVDSAKGFTVKCSRLPLSPPLPGPCSATPQFGPLGSLNQGVGWAWPDNTMYLGDSWSVTFDVIAEPNYPNSQLKFQVPLDACLPPPQAGSGPWSTACKPIPGNDPTSYTSMEYVTYAGSQLSPAQSFPPAFVTVLGGDPVNVTLSVSDNVGEVPFNPQFQVVASAGTAPFQFHFDFGDGGKLSLSSNNLSVGPVGYTYSTPGSYNVSLVTWDAVGHNFSIPVLQIHAVSPLNASLVVFQSGAVVPPGTTLLENGVLSFSVLHLGGWGPYSVDWYVNGTWMASTHGLWNYTGAPGQNCSIRAVLSDALGETTTLVRSFSILPVPLGGPPPQPLSVALFANRTQVPAGENVTLVGSASGGRAPFAWAWILGSERKTTAVPMMSVALSTLGNVTAELVVEDTDNTTAVSNTLTIWVTALVGPSTGGGKLQPPSDPSGGHVPPSPRAPTLAFSPWAPWLSFLLVLTSAYVSVMIGGLWLDRAPPRKRSSVRGNHLEERSRMGRRRPHVPLARRPSWHP